MTSLCKPPWSRTWRSNPGEGNRDEGVDDVLVSVLGQGRDVAS